MPRFAFNPFTGNLDIVGLLAVALLGYWNDTTMTWNDTTGTWNET